MVVLVFLAYLPVVHAGFVWDDDGHVTRAGLRSLAGLGRIWFSIGATQQYYPVLHSAFWLEHRLWGDAALGYHLTNVALHAAAACLLVLVLRRLAVPGAWLAGLLFALHPVMVESVAWVSEQKNTLAGVFYLSAALVYLGCGSGALPSASDCPGARKSLKASATPGGSRNGWLRYATATVLFVAAVLSKSVTATLPAALLVVLWWRQGRLSWRDDLRPLSLWLLIGAAAGLLTAWVERHYVGAAGANFDLNAVQRLLLAARVPWFYAGKLAWPFPLIFVYPRWTIGAASAAAWLYPAAGLLALAALARCNCRGALAAVCFFLGTLFPALGFFNVYPFVFSFVADHFQYLAAIGPIALGAAGWALARGRAKSAAVRAAWIAGAALLVTAAGALTWRQAGTYRTMETLYRATLAENPNAWLAHDNLGVVLAANGQTAEAMVHYRAALRLKPDYPQGYNNLGNLLAREGRWAEAIEQYIAALRVRPDFYQAEFDWGNALSDEGNPAGALNHYERALALNPVYPEAEYRMANALANSNRLPAAIDHYRRALAERPNYAEAEANLGLAYATAGRAAEGIAHLERALRLEPADAEAHTYLGFALQQASRLPEAAEQYRQSLRLHPDNPDARYQLAQVLERLGRADEAAALLQAAQPGRR
jgi:tetratricopeptide (TPR) repeat protein